NNTANAITFTVSLLPPLTSLAGQNLGIQDFGFNVAGKNPLAHASASSAPELLPPRRAANVPPPPKQPHRFVRFEVALSATGQVRAAPLVFELLNTGLGIASFAELSTGAAGEGNAFFSAHIAGFTVAGADTSAFFGGSAPAAVPLPAAGLLFPA